MKIAALPLILMSLLFILVPSLIGSTSFYDRSFRRDCHRCGISAVPEKEYTENDRRIIKKRGQI